MCTIFHSDIGLSTRLLSCISFRNSEVPTSLILGTYFQSSSLLNVQCIIEIAEYNVLSPGFTQITSIKRRLRSPGITGTCILKLFRHTCSLLAVLTQIEIQIYSFTSGLQLRQFRLLVL